MCFVNRPTGASSQSSQQHQPSQSSSSSELLCKVKYLNQLPDIPFDPKFIAYPFDPNRFIKYNPTSLESNFKWDILHEQDLGIRIDLINPDTYRIDPHAVLDEADEKLLEEETVNAADAKRSEQHNKSVAWLRRNEYISTENTRYQPKQYDQAESKVGYSIKRKISQLDFYKDRDSQIRAIEKSFEAAKKPIEKHFSKQGVFPVQVLPVYPDFDLWRHQFAQVIFDTDPSTKEAKGVNQNEEMSQAMIRGMVDEETGEQFVAYFLPTEETLSKRRKEAENEQNESDSEEKYDFKLIREYTWTMKTKANSGYEENYYFIIKDNAVVYNPLALKVRLNKRRSNKPGKVSNSRLVVKYRDFNKDELKTQKNRLRDLQSPGEIVENDDNDDDDDDEDENKNNTNNNDDESQDVISNNEDDDDTNINKTNENTDVEDNEANGAGNNNAESSQEEDDDDDASNNNDNDSD